MTTRAEEIAAKEYPPGCSPDAVIGITVDQIARLAFVNGYKQGQQDRWIPIAEGTPSGHVWLTGHAYNDPRTGDYWQKPGYYHEGSLYADDDFDPWDGYPPTHWIPALPSPPNPEQQ